MSVYKRKDSRFWSFDFQIDSYRFSGSTKATNERDAAKVEEAERVKAQALVDRVNASGGKPMTFAVAADRWWIEHGRYLDPATEGPVLEWMKRELGGTMLHAITDNDVSQLVQARRLVRARSGKDEHGRQLYKAIGPRTINKTSVEFLRRIVRYAIEHWNAAIIQQPKWNRHRLKVTKRPIREIAIAEELALDEIEDADFAELRRFAIITGLRKRAVLVTKPQVDFQNAIARIIKKGGEPQIVPLSREAYEILWRRRHDHETAFFTFVAQRTRVCPKTGIKFIRGQRYPISYYGFGTNQKRKWKKAGVDARLHDMRHTAGTRTLRATGNLKLVQMLLGHTDIKTTAMFYADVNVDDIRQGMDATAAASRRPALPPPKLKEE